MPTIYRLSLNYFQNGKWLCKPLVIGHYVSNARAIAAMSENIIARTNRDTWTTPSDYQIDPIIITD